MGRLGAVMFRLEVCVDTLDAAVAAAQGGGDRIELCANLAEQGTTPPNDLLAACLARLTIPVFPIIRPRTGDFVCSSSDVETMLAQVHHARHAGAHGLVVGALRLDGTVDSETIVALRREARSLPLTFHRAFDAARGAAAALDALMAIGVERVLTSGGAATAADGVAQIAALVRQSAGRIVVMAGGSVRAHNVRDIVTRTGVLEVHARLTSEDDVRGVIAAGAPSPEPE